MKSRMVEQLSECTGQDELAKLEADIQVHLRHYVRDFRMTIRDGGLILYGHTRTYYGKQLVQHCVMEWCCFPIRANNVEVL